jgi:hypothetical protein
VLAALERAEGERTELVAQARAKADSESASRVVEAEEQAAALRERAERRLGAAATRELAASASLEVALAALAATPYGHGVRSGQPLAETQAPAPPAASIGTR